MGVAHLLRVPQWFCISAWLGFVIIILGNYNQFTQVTKLLNLLLKMGLKIVYFCIMFVNVAEVKGQRCLEREMRKAGHTINAIIMLLVLQSAIT